MVRVFLPFHIIEAGSRIFDSFPRAHVLFIGEGEKRSEIERRLEALGLRRRFHLLGFRDDVPEILTASDILILPSRVEGFGYVLVEAMASGVPVIGSECGEIPNVVADSGLTFPEGDAAALRDRLLRLIRDPDLWTELARAGRERAMASFTQAEVARRTVAIYRELAARSP